MKTLLRILPVFVLWFAAGSVSAEGIQNLEKADQQAQKFIAESKGMTFETAASQTPKERALPGGVGAFAADVERRIVVFKKGTGKAVRVKSVNIAGARMTHDLWLINAVAIEAPKHAISSFDAKLKANPNVLRIDKDYVQTWISNTSVQGGCPDWWPPTIPCPFPDDGDGGGAGQKTPWGIERVKAPQAWAKSRGAGIKVAVIDTGVDSTHSELKVLGGFSSVEGDTSYEDGHGHGTHVAGTIAALDNDKGVIGVAPDAALYAVKVLNAKGEGTYATVLAGVQWAVENKMDVANMSLGGSETEKAFEEGMQAAADAGLTVVAAAGNSSGAVGYPAKYPSTIAVSASDSSNKGAYFSSRGPEVDVIAPGAKIYSTFKGGGYRTLDGTSMACPHVAGLAVLAAAATGARGLDQIRAALKSAATKLPGVSDDLNGAGMVDAEKLVTGSALGVLY